MWLWGTKIIHDSEANGLKIMLEIKSGWRALSASNCLIDLPNNGYVFPEKPRTREKKEKTEIKPEQEKLPLLWLWKGDHSLKVSELIAYSLKFDGNPDHLLRCPAYSGDEYFMSCQIW